MSLCRVTLFSRRLPALLTSQSRVMYSKDPKDGSIREAGGSFAKKGQAAEEQHFRKIQAEQLKNLKTHVDDEIKHHKEEIQRHQDAVNRLQQKSQDLEK